MKQPIITVNVNAIDDSAVKLAIERLGDLIDAMAQKNSRGWRWIFRGTEGAKE